MAARFTTVEDVGRFLESLPKFSLSGADAAHFALDHMEAFCQRMGDPQAKVPMVHVAGTNGKGSTCQMLASVYQKAGYKTGLYTSPHLFKFNERVRVDGVPVRDEEMLDFLASFEDAVEQIPVTYFEISTCLAFWFFEKTGCDLAIIETGLGGRLDATNVIDPLVSVITSVSTDHMDILGSTIEEIAKEKAGIIKAGRPVVTGRVGGEAMAVIESVAGRQRAKVLRATDYEPVWKDGKILLNIPGSGKRLQINAAGRKPVDRINAAMVFAVGDLLGKSLPVKIQDLITGIETVDRLFPNHAHFERLLPDRQWYFDGAHNSEAVDTLMEQLSAMEREQEPVFILSMMKDKIQLELLKNFQPYRYVYYIELSTERNATCDQIRPVLPHIRCFQCDDPEIQGILEGLKSKLVIFAGSFYFYQQVKFWMASQPPSDLMNIYGSCP